MEEQNTAKKRIFYTIVLILTLIIMIVSATLAYYNLIASQKEDSTVLYTGTLQISYVDGTYIKNPDLYPLTNVTYNTFDKVYRNSFIVNSNGSVDQTLKIDLDVTTNEFTENALMYAVFNDSGNELDRGYVPKSGSINLAENIFLGHGESVKYTVIIWLYNTDTNQVYEAGHIITGKITAYAKQMKY